MPDRQPCAWCGRRLDQPTGQGRRRRYCGQPCRQRAYEQRLLLRRTGLPADAVVLSAADLSTLHDRLFQLRCAAEDVITALDDGAEPHQLRSVAADVVTAARSLERLRP